MGMVQGLQNFFSAHELNALHDLEAQDFWLGWYQGKDSWYSHDTAAIGGKVTRGVYLTMGILPRVCTDWASLMLNENTLITITRSQALQAKLERIFDETGFLANMQQFVERYFAIGTGALVFGVDKARKCQISYVDGTRCFILGLKGGEPETVAFSKDYDDKNTLVSIHGVERGRYEVHHYLIDKESGKESNVREIGIDPVQHFDHPTFVWLKPAIARRSSWTTPYGQSIFAGAIDQNKMLDITFDGYANEFLMGRKRIFVAQDIIGYKTDKDGKRVPIFDPNDPIFSSIPDFGATEGGVGDKIKEVDMSLRQEQYSNAIQDGLNYVSANCFLGSHYYEFAHETGQITATQVVSANSVLYRNLRKQENALERPLKRAVQIMMATDGSKIDLTDINIKWDDSIIVDEETERENDRQDVRDGIMSRVEFRVKWYGESEQEAAAKIAQVEKLDLAPDFNTGIENDADA